MNKAVIKQGKEKSIRLRHPWIFKNSVLKVCGDPGKGEIIDITDFEGRFLAKGYYNPDSQISIRLLEWNEEVTIDETWWRDKLVRSIERRGREIFGERDAACRLVYAESDMIPGLIVDRYGEYIVLQALTAGIENVKELVVDNLKDILRPKGIYERSDADVRKLEGLEEKTGLLDGEEPGNDIEIKENGISFIVNIKRGQKTGFFLDQKRNRKIVTRYVKDKSVLDCFCYTGGFSVYALKNGAGHVTSVDSSEAALASLKKNLAVNKLSGKSCEIIEGDVYRVLRKFRDDGIKFDAVILDPPKLAPTRQSLNKAMRAYKDINMLAMKIINPEGILATFSCSGGVGPEDFKTVLRWASKDAGREVQVLNILSQNEDHPVRLSYPESEYLKGLVCRII